MSRLVTAVLFTLGLPSLAAPATIHVPEDQPTLWHALWNATSGDTILVAPGIYKGPNNRDLGFYGKHLTLASEAGPEATIIDGEHILGAFMFGEADSFAVLDGFTIRNGRGSMDGGGAILAYGRSTPLVRRCIFENNEALDGGAILMEEGSMLRLVDCIFRNNHASRDGGAVASLLCWPGQTPMEGCSFVGNTAGRHGGAICYWASQGPDVTRCTLVRNAAEDGGGIYSYVSSPSITNSILAFNDAGGAVSCVVSFPGTTPSLTHCVAFGNAGGDSLCGDYHDNLFGEDPRFCGLASGDLSLCSNSDCLAENSPWGEAVGAYGQGCDKCESAAEPTSWGVIKALFR
jgi:Right handed beta helix region